VKKDVNLDQVELKTKYEKHYYRYASAIATGVFLILFSVVNVIVLMDIFGDDSSIPIISLLGFIIIAVFIFIYYGMAHTEFQNEYQGLIEKELFTKAERSKFHNKFRLVMSSGVMLIFLSVIIVIILDSIVDDMWPNAVMIFLIGIAVFMFVYYGLLSELYTLPYEKKMGKSEKMISKINGVIMLLSIGVYIVMGFVANLWQSGWIVIVVGVILCKVVSIIFQK